MQEIEILSAVSIGSLARSTSVRKLLPSPTGGFQKLLRQICRTRSKKKSGDLTTRAACSLTVLKCCQDWQFSEARFLSAFVLAGGLRLEMRMLTEQLRLTRIRGTHTALEANRHPSLPIPPQAIEKLLAETNSMERMRKGHAKLR